MNNEKIGKFISKLRKAKNLTQQQLGDLVGVGGKSVSKWERGINMPDISIINEVSKILGITSDELLQGEFNKKSTNEEYLKKKNQRRYRLLLIILIIFTSIFTILLISYFKNDTHTYWISGSNEDFKIDGILEYNKEEYTINIENIYCNLSECQNLYISNINVHRIVNSIGITADTGFVNFADTGIPVSALTTSEKLILYNKGYWDCFVPNEITMTNSYTLEFN